MATATSTVTVYDTQATYKAMAIEELRQAWQACEKHSLAFGKVCYKWRERLSDQGSRSNTGLRSYLDEVGIPVSTAYYWIEKYEISIGVKQAKPTKAKSVSEPDVSEPDVSEPEPSFTTETPEDFSDLPDPATVTPDLTPTIPASVPAVPMQEDSDTKKLQKQFPKCTGILVKASTVKDGLKSCQNRFNLIGLTKRQIEEYATYLLAKRNP
jgi:hypothetical protein